MMTMVMMVMMMICDDGLHFRDDETGSEIPGAQRDKVPCPSSQLLKAEARRELTTLNHKLL